MKPFRIEILDDLPPFEPGIELESMMVRAWTAPGEEEATGLFIVLFSQRPGKPWATMRVDSRERVDQLIEVIKAMRDRVWPGEVKVGDG